VTPRTIVLGPLLGATLTLTASGGPVTWSITESAGLIGQLHVAPSAGRLLAGQSATVTLSVSSAAAGLIPQAAFENAAAVCVGCQLTVNPGGISVLVIIDAGVVPSSPPPSSGSPPPEAGGRLAN
jgi:hypothetical protein